MCVCAGVAGISWLDDEDYAADAPHCRRQSRSAIQRTRQAKRKEKKENEESSLKTVGAMADLYSSRDAFLKEFEVHKRVVILCVDSRIGLEIFFPTASSIDPREPLACKQQQQRTFFSLSHQKFEIFRFLLYLKES